MKGEMNRFLGPPVQRPARPTARLTLSTPLAASGFEKASWGTDAPMQVSFLERAIPSENTKAPVLILIHGRGDSPENFIHLTDGVTVPRRELALRGTRELDFGFSRGWEWFSTMAGDGDTPELAQDIENAASLVAQTLHLLNEKENENGRRFVISGFSQGGMLTYALALLHPELVSCALPIAGLLPPACRPNHLNQRHSPPIHAFHGLADDLVCPLRAQDLITELKSKQYPVTFKGYPGVEHTVSPAMLSDYEDALNHALTTAPRDRR